MRLNWFSPLPPQRSGIADYTMRLLPALTACAEVVLWTDQEAWEPRLEQYAPVRSYQLKDMPWVEINRGDMSVFHLGNNHRFHGEIWQISQRHAGLVILHDIALQQFFAGLYREQWRDRAGYVALMEHYYGTVGRQDAEDFWAGRLSIDYMAQQYRLTRYAVEHALGVLLHTPRSVEELKHDIPCPLVYSPLPYPAAPPSDHRPQGAPKPRGDRPPYRLIIFGHISDNRRLGSVLQALAGFPDREAFHLDIYGELWDPQSTTQHLQALALQPLVTLHDFVPSAELEAALAAAHLAINLRFPTMGEASVSQLQIWDHALPSLVTRVGWYAGLPEETVAFVRPDHEIADIRSHLSAFLADPSRYAKIGENGRRLLESRHTPEGYTHAILTLVGQARSFRPNAIAHDLARRVGAEMRLWTSGSAPDVTPDLWGQVIGLESSEPGSRKAVAGMSYRHMDALKGMRQVLSDQVQQFQRQLSFGLEALRRATSEELYTPRPPHEQPEPGASRERGKPLTSAVVDTPARAKLDVSPPAWQGELTSPDGAIPGQPRATAHRPPDSHGAMGEGGPRKSYTREDALRYPMSIQAHDTGFRYLFNFIIVAKSLGLRPGDAVLDFATGSGFVSELLNRLGYVTVAFDIDHELLAIGQERLTLDPRCDPKRVRFVTGDGMRLPFRAESFDGIICMNALHHMPDYRLTLAEMCRVLKAGGRAVFAEPGDQHSKSPESILAMEQYGALEKDIVLPEIYQLARAVGFRRMLLKPYVQPGMLELDYEEFEHFREGGKVSTPFLTPPEIAEFVKGQPLFCLEKAGVRPLTSAHAPAETLRARITIQECATRVPRQGRLKVLALCENVGQSTWLATPGEFGGYVTLGIKLLTPDGRVLEDSRGRQRLSRDVPPGSQIEVRSEVSVEGLEPGRYRMLFDMVNELVCWFQSVGSETVERWIEVF
jgi:ubiquinone/menaquinone biosynthesis C-methylase UbiE/glycosyltransferase involved in cell wall biosynthesis